MPPLRLIVCDDSVLFREGLCRVLTDMGFEVVARCDSAEALLELVPTVDADIAIVDVRMPPTYTREGIQAAITLGGTSPALGVLVLSQYVGGRTAVTVLGHTGGGRGYLLKDRISNLDELADALRRVGAGGSVVDPVVAASLVGRRRDELDVLTARELEILGLMAEGRSNVGICERLQLSPRTVESHVAAIFRKLGLAEQPDGHRRVLAVLAYLRPGG